MKPGKGGDSTDALKAVWMEGYERGREDERRFSSPPVVVEIDPADIVAAYAEPCATPDQCPACASQIPADISVVDRDRLTRRNPDHLDDWRFR